MSEQKLISKWLTLAGQESPKKQQFPENNKFQLALGLVLEELIEAAESGSDEQANEFFDHASLMIAAAQFKIVGRKIVGRKREEGNLNELRDACADLRVVMGNLIHFAGTNKQYEKDFKEVMKSNFSKFCESEEEANLTIEAYANGTHPNKKDEKIKCYHVKVEDYWIIKRAEDGKILKSINFKDAEL
jgi:hypothetical protein